MANKLKKIGPDNQTGVVATALAQSSVVQVTDQFDNAVSGFTVTFGSIVTPGGAAGTSLSSASGISAADGTVSTKLTLGDKAGIAPADKTYTFTANGAGLTPPSLTFTSTAQPGPLASLFKVPAGDNQTGPVAQALTNPLTVEARDQFSNPIPSLAVAFAISATPGGATGQLLSAPTVTTGLADGRASTSLTLGNRPGVGAYQVDATALGVPSVTFSETATAGAAHTISIVSGTPQTGPQNTALPKSLIVVVQDAFSNPVTTTVTFTPSAGSVTPTAPTTDALGKASTSWTLGASGAQTVTATCVCSNVSSVQFSATAFNVTPFAIVKLTGDTQPGIVGSTLPGLLTARVTNALGDLCAPVGCVVSTGGGSLVVQNGATTTDSLGQIAASLTLGPTAGANSVTVTCPSCTTPTFVVFTATGTAAAPTTLLLRVGSGQAGVANATLPQALVTAVTDAQGNGIADVTVTFAITGKPTVGTTGQDLSALSAATNAEGLALSTLTLGNTAGLYTITATCSVCTTVSTVTFTATVASSTKLVKVSGDGQYALTSSALTRRMRGAVADSTGQPVQGVPVTFAITQFPVGSSGQALERLAAVSDAKGEAASRLTTGTEAGAYQVTMSCASCDSSANQLVFAATALPSFALSGTVAKVDILNAPIAGGVPGAQLTVAQPQFGLSFKAVAGAGGAFIVQLAPGGGTLSYSAAGFTGAGAVPVGMSTGGLQSPSQSNLVVTLILPGATIGGTVRDRSNALLANAYVSAVEVDPATVSNPQPIAGGRSVSAIANGSGVYSLPVPQNTFWKVTATAPEMGVAFVDLDSNDVADIVASGAAGSTGQDIRFPAATPLTGTLRVGGQLVSGAIVGAEAVGSAPLGGSVTTNTSGQFTLFLPIPPTGATYTYIVNGTVQGLGQLIPRAVTVNSAGKCLSGGSQVACVANFNQFSSNVTVNFVNQVSAPVAVTGTVIVAANNTVAGVSVGAPSNAVQVAGATSVSIPVASVGTVTGVANTVFGVTANLGGSVFTPASGAVTAPCSVVGATCLVGGNPVVSIVIPTPLTISGLAQQQTDLNLDGDYDDVGETVAAAGANVTVVSDGAFAVTISAAANGSFTVNVLSTAATYSVTATKSGFLSAVQTVSTNSGSVVGVSLKLPTPQATISGLVNGVGAGVDVTVTATSEGRTVSVPRGQSTANCSASPTKFCMSVVPGTWILSATADGYVMSSAASSVTITSPTGSSSNNHIHMNKVKSKEAQSQSCNPAAGCSNTFPGSRITVLLPAGAGGGNSTLTVTVQETTNAPTTATFQPAFIDANGNRVAIDIKVTDSTGQQITQFNPPLTFTIAGLGGGGVIGYFDAVTGNWAPSGNCTSTGSGATGSVTCTTDHLTKFSLLISKVTAVTAPSTGGGGGGGGGGGTNPVTTPVVTTPGTSATGTISGTTGGSVTTTKVTATAPNNVVSGASSVSLTVSENPNQTMPAPPVGGYYLGTTFTTSLMNGNTAVRNLDSSLTLTVKLSDADIAAAGGDTDQLRVVRYDEASKTWMPLDGLTVDLANKTISGTTKQTGLFAVTIAVPTPEQTGPTEASLVVGLNPALTWNQARNTKQFQVQVVPANNDGPGINLIIGAPELVALGRYDVLPPKMGFGNYVMLPGMTYTWRVRSTSLATSLGENDPGWSEWTAPRSFRTSSASSVTIKAVAPNSGADQSRTPKLEWSDLNSRIFYYEVQLSQDKTFETDPTKATASVTWELVHGGISSPQNSYQVKEAYKLDAGATYYWRVRPRVQGDGNPVDWSDTWAFTVAP
ncbi:MAG: hypothetical protein NTZ05_00135 [Chloroflexi bacterium]|nr:hypothetical protein [Chloroflexota bacterium]